MLSTQIDTNTPCVLHTTPQVYYSLDEMLLNGARLQHMLPTLKHTNINTNTPCILHTTPQVYYILDEMLLNGCIVDTNKTNILEPVQLLEQVQ